MKARLIGKTPLAGLRGSSTLEILIAFAILALSITAVILLVFGSQSLSVDTQTNTEALAKARASLELARAQARGSFSSLASSGPTADGIYSKSLTVESVDDDTKKIASTVSWQDGARALSIVLSSLVTNPSGSRCNQTLSGDWSAPQIYGYVDFPSASGASGISVLNGTAFISSDPSSPSTDDFYAVDVSAEGPGVGALPKRGHFSTTLGLTDVEASGNYAYATAHSGTAQLLVIDIHDPDALTAGSIKASIDVTAPSDTAYGNTLLYKNKKIYLGLTKSSGPEFYIIDVSTPSAPQVQGSFEVGAAVNQIALRSGIVYLATASSTEIFALNVQNPNNPSLVGAYASATLTGQSLAFDSAGTLYFGRTGGSGNPKLLAFDPSSLAAPLWSMDMGTQSDVYTMVARSSIIFMTTGDPNDGLQLWDVSTAPNPTRFDTSPLNIQQGAKAGYDCVAELLYVAQRSNRAMQVVGPYVPFSYGLAMSNDISLKQGASATTTATATLTGGIAQKVTLKVTGLPAGATASLSPASCTPTCSSAITVTAGGATPPGSYTVAVSGTGGVSTQFTLTVTAQPFDYSLSNSGNVSIKQGNAGVVTVNASLLGGTAQSVSFATSSSPVLPASVSITKDKNSCSPTCTMTLTIKPASDPATKNKTYAITVTGSSAGLPNKTTSFTLTVKP